MQHVVLVDPYGASLQGVAYTDSGVQVLSVDSRGETIGGCVANSDGVFLGLELGDGADRAKDLILHDLHVFADVGEDGWLNEIALVTVSLSTNLDLGSFLTTGVDVSGSQISMNISKHCGDQKSGKVRSYPMMRSNWSCETCGPWNVSLANGSPTTFFWALALKASKNLS